MVDAPLEPTGEVFLTALKSVIRVVSDVCVRLPSVSIYTLDVTLRPIFICEEPTRVAFNQCSESVANIGVLVGNVKLFSEIRYSELAESGSETRTSFTVAPSHATGA